MRWLVAIVLCLPLVLAEAAHSHTRSQSASRWQVENSHVISAIFQVDLYRVTLLPLPGDNIRTAASLLGRHLERTILVHQGTDACSLARNISLPAASSRLRHKLSFTCPKPLDDQPAVITVNSFFAHSPVHQHFLHFALPGQNSIERVLTADNRHFSLDKSMGENMDTGLPNLLWHGGSHVAGGPDHVLFILVLVLYARQWRRIILLATCFTLGHMLSLFGVALGLVTPDDQLVEALIGLSIMSVALHSLARHQSPPRSAFWIWMTLLAVMVVVLLVQPPTSPAFITAILAMGLFIAFDIAYLRQGPSRFPVIALVTLLFSLAHGAGFAGPLLDMDLPQDGLLTTILFFNIGVELAQIAIITVLLGLGLIMRRIARDATLRRIQVFMSALLVGIGLYWFVERLIAW